MDRKTRRLNDVDGQPSRKKRREKRIGAEGKIWASVDKISVKAPFRERGGRRRRHRRRAVGSRMGRNEEERRR